MDNRLDKVKELTQKQADKIGLSLTSEQLSMFGTYYNFLLAENIKYNLTGICEPREVVSKHFTDSLLCATLNIIKGSEHMIDIGSGAGFPGIPLKIFYSGINLVLLESNRKKVFFLKSVVEKLQLTGVEIIWDRAENIGQDRDYRETFDLAVSRAVAGLPVLLEYCLPLVGLGGHFLALKGPGADKEMDACGDEISLLGGELKAVHRLKLPCSGEKRRILVYLKRDITDKKYPRRPGIPAKRPL